MTEGYGHFAIAQDMKTNLSLGLLKKAVTATAVVDIIIIGEVVCCLRFTDSNLEWRSPSWGTWVGAPASTLCFSVYQLRVVPALQHLPWAQPFPCVSPRPQLTSPQADGVATHKAGLWGHIHGAVPRSPFRVSSTVGARCFHCGCCPLSLCSVEVSTLVFAIKKMKQVVTA